MTIVMRLWHRECDNSKTLTTNDSIVMRACKREMWSGAFNVTYTSTCGAHFKNQNCVNTLITGDVWLNEYGQDVKQHTIVSISGLTEFCFRTLVRPCGQHIAKSSKQFACECCERNQMHKWTELANENTKLCFFGPCSLLHTHFP